MNEWDEAGIFPREHQKAASVGLMGLGYDAEHGGIPDAVPFMSCWQQLRWQKLDLVVCIFRL